MGSCSEDAFVDTFAFQSKGPSHCSSSSSDGPQSKDPRTKRRANDPSLFRNPTLVYVYLYFQYITASWFPHSNRQVLVREHFFFQERTQSLSTGEITLNCGIEYNFLVTQKTTTTSKDLDTHAVPLKGNARKKQHFLQINRTTSVLLYDTLPSTPKRHHHYES